MLKQSETLTNFYRAYNSWLETGAPLNEGFVRYQGLCTNLFDWADRHERSALMDELEEQFFNANLDTLLPFNCSFNNGNGPRYSDEVTECSCHLNAKRIAWVKEHI